MGGTYLGKWFSAVAMAGSLLVPPTAAAAGLESACSSPPAFDPIALYGEHIEFEVRRNGTPVGMHTVRFSQEGDALIADSRFSVAVRVLFVTAYRFVYQSRSVWRDGCLQALTASINDDGKRFDVKAERVGDVIKVFGPEGQLVAPAGVYPTDHWHPGVIGTSSVLNTLTGRINQIEMINHGEVMVQANGRQHLARHYAYTGELTTEVWYDREGRWVGLRFTAADGSTIENICQRCISPSVAGS